MNLKRNPDPPAYLKRLLLECAQYAWLARDCVQKLDNLSGEAHVWLYITSAREFHLAIWRSKVYPSDVEYWTFFRALPDPIKACPPLPVPEKIEHHGRKILKVHWRIVDAAPFGEDDAAFAEEHADRTVDAQ